MPFPPIINVFKLRVEASHHICTYKKYLPLSGQWENFLCIVNMSWWHLHSKCACFFATILMNIFFAYCMIISLKGPVNSIKLLLNVLLWSLIGCNLILNILNLLLVFFDFVDPAPWIRILSATGLFFLPCGLVLLPPCSECVLLLPNCSCTAAFFDLDEEAHQTLCVLGIICRQTLLSV